jgi:hypothetical protein
MAIGAGCSSISSFDVPGAAMEFRVIWENDIDAEGPKEGVRAARAIQLTPGMSAIVIHVWAYVAGKMHRIDLVEEPDRLNRDELFAVRAGLRSSAIQTCPRASEMWQTVMFIFLDGDNADVHKVRR